MMYMAKKTVKKVDVKKVEKLKIMAIVAEALRDAGYAVGDAEDYGFTQGTLVVQGEKCDVQIKPITPKAGVDRYEMLEEEDEEEVEASEEA
jgi:hypothetical protein